MNNHFPRSCLVAGLTFCSAIVPDFSPVFALKMSSTLEDKKDPLSLYKSNVTSTPPAFVPVSMRTGFVAPLTANELVRPARPALNEEEVRLKATQARATFEAKRNTLSSEIKAIVPEEIWSVVPASVLNDMGFTQDLAPAALSQRFFKLYHEIRSVEAIGMDPLQLKKAAYFSIIQASHHLKIATTSADPTQKSDLLISTAQLCRWASLIAPTEEARSSLVAQANERLNKASHTLYEAYAVDSSWGKALEGKLSEERGKLMVEAPSAASSQIEVLSPERPMARVLARLREAKALRVVKK